MKKLLILGCLLMLCASARATQITISSFQPGMPWRYGGTTATLRVSVSQSFLDSDGSFIPASTSTNFHKSVTCTLASTTITCPSFVLSSTTNGNPTTARYKFQFYGPGAANIPRDVLFSNYQLPVVLGTTITIAQLVAFNQSTPTPPRPGFPDTQQVQALINAVLPAPKATTAVEGIGRVSVTPADVLHPIFVGDNDPRLPSMFQSTYLNTCAGSNDTALITAAIAVGKPIVIPFGVTCASNNITISVPLYVEFTGRLKPITGQTVTITSVFGAGQWQTFTNATAGLGTISFAGNKSQLELQIRWWGPAIDGSTNDNAAWQAAWNAGCTMKVATIDIPAGVSIATSIVSAAYSSAGNEGIHITINGLGAPPTEAGSFPGTLQVSTRSSVIKSTTAGTAGVFTQAGSPYQAVSLTLKNVIVRREDNPSGPAVDWQNGFGLYLENFIWDTGRYTTDVVTPTHPEAIGVIFPGASNAGTQSIRGDSWGQGYYSGLSAGEHTTQTGHLAISGCIEGLLLPAGGQIHTVSFTRLQVYNNSTNIRVEGTANIHIEVMNIEHAVVFAGIPAWQITGLDIDDGSNTARGDIRYLVNKAFTGLDSTFTRNGGFFVATRELRYEKQWSTFVSGSANISIPDNVDTTVAFNTTDANTALADLSNTQRIKPTQYGDVYVRAQVRFASNATGIRAVRIWKHDGFDATDKLINICQVAALSGGFQTPVDCDAQAVAGHPDDYLFISLLQNSGGALNSLATASPDITSPRFSMRY